MSEEHLIKSISSELTCHHLIEMVKKKFDLKDISLGTIEIIVINEKLDSFLSVISKFNINAKGTDEKGIEQEVFLPVITKSLFPSISARLTFRSADFFLAEQYFYEKVWPVLKDFKKSKGIEDIDEVPLMLAAHCDGENDFLALENLQYSNFTSFKRKSSLNYSQSLMFLKLLAKFHALSIACKDQNPSFVEIGKGMKETYFAEELRQWYVGYQKNLLQCIQYAVKNQLNRSYVDIFENLIKSDFYGTICELCCIQGPLTAVTQGDAWLPNFLVKHSSDSTICDVILIDFQLARYTSICNDVTFFIYACASEEVLNSHWDSLIEEYHKALNERIVELGSPDNLISLKCLRDGVEISAIFGIGMSLEALVFSLKEDEEVYDMNQINGCSTLLLEEVWLTPPFKDDAKNRKLASIVKHGIDRGFIK